MRPGSYLSYVTSSMFIIGGLFIMYEGYFALGAAFAVIAAVVFWSVAVAVPVFIVLKLYAMYMNDVYGPVGGLTTKHATEHGVKQKVLKALPGRK